jgi:hypothetical protein
MATTCCWVWGPSGDEDLSESNFQYRSAERAAMPFNHPAL